MFHAARKHVSHVFITSSLGNIKGNDLFLSPCRICSLKNYFWKLPLILQFTVFLLDMSSLNFFKLCKILADHDQCIQWCKEHNLLASSIMYPRENCSNTLTEKSAGNRGKWRKFPAIDSEIQLAL